jgi:hypothetical protein
VSRFQGRSGRVGESAKNVGGKVSRRQGVDGYRGRMEEGRFGGRFGQRGDVIVGCSNGGREEGDCRGGQMGGRVGSLTSRKSRSGEMDGRVGRGLGVDRGLGKIRFGCFARGGFHAFRLEREGRPRRTSVSGH